METAKGAPDPFSSDFLYGFNKEIWGKLPRELQTHFPLILNKDLIRIAEGRPPSELQTHAPSTRNKELLRSYQGDLMETAKWAPDPSPIDS